MLHVWGGYLFRSSVLRLTLIEIYVCVKEGIHKQINLYLYDGFVVRICFSKRISIGPQSNLSQHDCATFID